MGDSPLDGHSNDIAPINFLAASSTEERLAIDKACRELRRDHPLRPVMQSIQARRECDSVSVSALTEYVCPGHKRREQMLAAWALGLIPLDEEARNLAIKRLTTTLDNRPRRHLGWV